MNTIRQLLFATLIFAIAQPGIAASENVKLGFADRLVPAYLKIQTALAADDLPGAKSAAGELLAAAEKSPELKAFTESTEAMASAANIGVARASFLKVSDELIALIDRVGSSGGPALFVAHCPMAFGGKGGDWLQADKKINNPYFGASMLRCGSIKRQAMSTPASHGGHGEHP